MSHIRAQKRRIVELKSKVITLREIIDEHYDDIEMYRNEIDRLEAKLAGEKE